MNIPEENISDLRLLIEAATEHAIDDPDNLNLRVAIEVIQLLIEAHENGHEEVDL